MANISDITKIDQDIINNKLENTEKGKLNEKPNSRQIITNDIRENNDMKSNDSHINFKDNVFENIPDNYKNENYFKEFKTYKITMKDKKEKIEEYIDNFIGPIIFELKTPIKPTHKKSNSDILDYSFIYLIIK